MKRGLVFTLCALALAASVGTGRAQTIDLTLNLRFNDPTTPTEGGVWYLLGNTTGGATNLGIAGVSAYLQNVTTSVFHGSGVTLGAGQNPNAHAYPVVGQATINNLENGGNPFNGVFANGTNVVYGQDLSIAGIISGIGQGGAGNVAADPLKNPTYNNYSLLLSGTFNGGSTVETLPRFTPGAPHGGNVLVSTTPGVAAVQATITTHVRGDSLGSLNLNSVPGAGLRGGDANRDGIVNNLDFGIMSGNFDPPNSTGTRTWDQGNFNGDAQNGRVDNIDFGILSGNFSPPNGPGIPPSVAAVPEPASAALLGLALMGVAIRRKRR